MTDPPVPPDVHDTSTCESPELPTTDAGASGVVYGVTAADLSDTPPVPASLVADTLNTYPVTLPLVSPDTVAGDDVEVPSAYVDHDAPPSVDYSIV